MIALLLALSLSGPVSSEIRVDCVELNHIYDCRGKRISSQWILWRWGRWSDGPGHRVGQWMLAKGDYWHRREHNRHELRLYRDLKEIVIITPSFRETHTVDDPERRDRDRLPEENRRPYLVEFE